MSAARIAQPRLAQEQRWIAALFLCVVVAQCLLIAGAVFVVDATRAYVTGESLWSKAQKSAASHLLRYATTREPGEFALYRREIAVPLADRAAREAMTGAPRDPEAAERGLVAGRNHRDDADGMVVFLRFFRSAREVDQALGIWTRADAGIAELDRLAEALRAAVESPSADAAAIAPLVAAIERIDGELTALEEDFSYALGAAARRVRRGVVIGASAAGAVTVLLGALLILRLLARVRHFEGQRRKLVEHANDLFTLIDPQGRYRFISPNIEDRLGWTPEELEGHSALEFIHADDLPRVVESLATVVAQPERAQRVEFRFRHKDGSHRVFESVGTRLVGEAGTEVVVVSRDVTESRALEQELLRAQKMESIGRLAGGIAHDFNNVLTALIAHAEEARAKPDDARLVRGELDEILLGAQRAARLTHQLLAFARRQVIAPRVVDLGRLLLGLRPMLARLLGESIELDIRVAPEPCAVRADPGQIEQVVVNLALNARDAMPDGGRLAIEATHGPVTPDAVEETIVLAVADTGCGIDDATASHLFEPFFTTKPSGQGTGLGLATCYGIVQQAGGEIRVSSAPGRGTRFEVVLPRARTAVESRAPAVDVEAPGGHESILVVEDEAMVRHVTVRHLEAKGYAVLAAEDGVAALALLESRAGAIALVVSDVAMPRLGGPALAARIAVLWPKTRVLLVSGHADDTTVARDAAVPFLQKPFTREQLAHAVRRALDG